MQIPIRQYWQLLTDYLRPQWPRVALLAVLLTSSIGLQLYNPQLLRAFIDAAMEGTEPERLPWLALLFIGVALLNQLIAALAHYVGENVAWTATNGLRADLTAHCLRLDLAFHKHRPPGELVERIDGDVTQLSNFFSQFFIDVLANGVLMVGVLLLLFGEDWRAGLGMSIFAAVTLWAMTGVRKWATRFWTEERQLSAELYGFLGEALAGTEDLRSCGAEGYALGRYYRILRPYAWVRQKSGLGYSLMWNTSLLLFAAGTAVAFLIGGSLWQAGAISLGTVYLIFHYTELLRRPIERIRMQLQDLQKAGAAIYRVRELQALQPQIQDGPGTPLPPGPLSVSFDQVSFHYEDDEELVLREISFDLRPGQVLGLLGRTGSGKSTLARLLLRFYDPTDGEIRLGGVPIREAQVAALRQRVGFVTQDVQLFEATVRDNLTFFDRSIPDERLLEVIDELGLGPWYRSLPHGLETMLEPGGGGLSAGEAQLLAFARIFLRDPGLVIMDEASSRLDPATEALVERAVTRLLHGRTGIIIAHRLATVQRADQIIILEGGRILEQGERQLLAADPDSRFAQLLRTGLEEVLA